jgi:hypothetical protein
MHEGKAEVGHLLARCVVCKGNIHTTDQFEVWEGA